MASVDTQIFFVCVYKYRIKGGQFFVAFYTFFFCYCCCCDIVLRVCGETPDNLGSNFAVKSNLDLALFSIRKTFCYAVVLMLRHP